MDNVFPLKKTAIYLSNSCYELMVLSSICCLWNLIRMATICNKKGNEQLSHFVSVAILNKKCCFFFSSSFFLGSLSPLFAFQLTLSVPESIWLKLITTSHLIVANLPRFRQTPCLYGYQSSLGSTNCDLYKIWEMCN